MPFEKLDVPLGALDTKTDPVMLATGALAVAENCSTQKVGVYTKRRGYTVLAQPFSGSGVKISRLAARGGQLLSVSNDGSLRAYDGASDRWSGGGRTSRAQTVQRSVFLDQALDVTVGTRASVGGYTVHAFNSSTGVTAVVTNTSTNEIVFTSTIEPGFAASIMHSAVVGSRVVLVFSRTSSQEIRGISILPPNGIGTTTLLYSGANVNATLAAFDLTALSATECVLAWSTNTPDIRVAKIRGTPFGVVAGPVVLDAVPVDSGIAAIAITGDIGAAIYHTTAGAGMRGVCFDPATLAVSAGPFLLEAVTSPPAINCSLVRGPSRIRAFWDRAASGISKQHVRSIEFTTGGTVLGPMVFIYNVALAAKAHADVTSSIETMVNLWSPAGKQSTYFTVGANSTFTLPLCWLAAMHAPRTAYASAQVLGQLPDVDFISSTKVGFSAPIAYKFLSTATARAGWATFELDYESTTQSIATEAIGNAYLAGGCGIGFDGFGVREMNFPLYPEITQATPGSVASGGMDDGTYSYIAIFEASDINGNTDRSTTSIAVLATTSAGAGAGKVTLTIDSLAITRVGQSLAPAGIISIFRTNANAEEPLTHRFVGSVTMNPLVASVTFVDQANDSTIQSNRVLYTDGGVLDREPPPPSMQMIVHKGRMWGISSADRKTLFYSGKIAAGEGIWFSSAQQMRVDDGGDCVALASMDDKLVVFKSDRVYKVYGDGPNALGENNDLTEPIFITGDAGCIDPRSIVTTHSGVCFLSSKGLYELSRGEELVYRGEPADAYWSGYSSVVAATMLPDRQEVRFEVSGGAGVADALSGAAIAAQKVVFNYATGQWTTHRNYLDATAADGIVVGGSYYWCSTGTNGKVYKESSSSYLDPSSTFVRMLVRTGWIKPAGFQGFARVNRCNVLSQRKTDHAFTLFAENDYVAGSTSTKTWSAATLSALAREQVSLHLARQKGESYRFTFYDGQDGTLGTGEAYSVFGLQLRAKEIRGTFEKLLVAGAKG